MKPMTILLITLFLSLCSTAQANGLVGKWKSNEEMTLTSMKTVEDKIPKKTQNLFKSDFFGHLINEYKTDSFRFYFDQREINRNV